MDRLEIIRHMLNTIGEGGVSDQDSLHPSVITCNSVLDSENTDFQSTGWWFNTDYGLELAPNQLGELIVPSDALSIKRSGNDFLASSSQKSRYTRRAGKIYDNQLHTYNIGAAMKFDVTYKLEIVDLPPVASIYLKHRSAATLYDNDDGDQFKSQRLKDRVDMAFFKLKAEHMKVLSINANDSVVGSQLRQSNSSAYSGNNSLLRFGG